MALSAGGLAAGLGAGGPPAASQAEAGDSMGSGPGRLAVSELVVTDGEGRDRIVLAMVDDTPRLVLKDEQGRMRAFVGRVGDWWAMNLVDGGQTPRTVCASRHDGAGSSWQVRDNQGQMRFVVGFTDRGNGGISMRDARGRRRLGLGMPVHAGYSLHLLDEDEEGIWSVP
jgi:hypothetical protein